MALLGRGMKGKIICCFIPNQDDPQNSRCPNNAEWRIVYGETPDDYTESCTEHVGKMLTDAKEHRIYPISENERAGYDWLEANYAKAP
jgi:hypothetical protein